MLRAKQFSAGYGNMKVLHNLNFELLAGTITAVLGRNGAGRSTLAKALMGMIAWSGKLRFQGINLEDLETYEIARIGMAYVPEEREVFSYLTVEENLRIGQLGENTLTLEQAYELFPALAERKLVAAASLSGGEQQMLSIARALMSKPKCLLLDEPSEGLAPAVLQTLQNLLHKLRAQGLAILLIEQKRDWALSMADYALLLGNGRLILEGAPSVLLERQDLLQQWLQV